MPIKRIGEGLLVIGMVAIAAMIVTAFLSRSDNAALTITAVLGFGASAIGGVLAVLNKLEDILVRQDTTHDKLDRIHDDTNSTLQEQKSLLAEALEKIKELEKQ